VEVTDVISGQPVKIVVDSTASLPPEVLSDHGITVVPIAIQIGSETFDEDVTITKEEFYRHLAGDTQPVTSQPSPGTFFQVYRSVIGQARSIVSIHLTGKHSGTVQSARMAAEMLPDADITVVDSELTSAAMGLLALVAAQSARLGQSKQEVLAAIEEARSRIFVYVCVPTLAYLRRSGRVSFAQAALADILAVKPILTMRNGFLQVTAKVRTYRRALDRVITLMEEQIGDCKVQAAIVHANAPGAAEDFKRDVVSRLNVVSVMVSDIGSALAAHGGPGMLGLACLKL
jgi:DegV family protein with EDD domain